MKCVFAKGSCQKCGKSEDQGHALCYYDDPFWFKEKKKKKKIIVAPKKAVFIYPKYDTLNYFSKKSKIKRFGNPKPIKSTPITVNNFFLASKGTFDEIYSIPEGYESIFKSKGSEYFINKDKSVLIRRSDHWGFGIKDCNWYLGGYGHDHCSEWRRIHGSSLKMGIINIGELQPLIHSFKKGKRLSKTILPELKEFDPSIVEQVKYNGWWDTSNNKPFDSLIIGDSSTTVNLGWFIVVNWKYYLTEEGEVCYNKWLKNNKY